MAKRERKLSPVNTVLASVSVGGVSRARSFFPPFDAIFGVSGGGKVLPRTVRGSAAMDYGAGSGLQPVESCCGRIFDVFSAPSAAAVGFGCGVV